jgi:hypothetical protein
MVMSLPCSYLTKTRQLLSPNRPRLRVSTVGLFHVEYARVRFAQRSEGAFNPAFTGPAVLDIWLPSLRETRKARELVGPDGRPRLMDEGRCPPGRELTVSSIPHTSIQADIRLGRGDEETRRCPPAADPIDNNAYCAEHWHVIAGSRRHRPG